MQGEDSIEILLKLRPALLSARSTVEGAHLCFAVLDAPPVAQILLELPLIMDQPDVSYPVRRASSRLFGVNIPISVELMLLLPPLDLPLLLPQCRLQTLQLLLSLKLAFLLLLLHGLG